MGKEYSNLFEVIKNNLNNPETEEALNLIKYLSDAPKKGFVSKDQFYKIAMWKTPRPKKYYMSNSEKNIKIITKKVLSPSSDEEKINNLIVLKGVSIPVASSILTILNPKDYGIIDIRVWQLLYLYDEVKTKPGGQGFVVGDYLTYLSILRKYASIFNLNVRDIERILFFYHKKIQDGKLYN